MIDHLVGRPNPSWKRAQVFFVIIFWIWRIVRGASGPPRVLWFPRINRALQRFTPWQIIASTLTTVYAIRNFDKILGLNAPEPLARLYSPSYYRATWIATGLDAGFATAMSIRPKWLRDLSSIIFSVYYILYAQEADEKLRRYRAVPTVEMLRTTWEKTSNPYIRFLTRAPRVSIQRKILLPRPKSSSYDRPITAYLYFAPPAEQLINHTEIVLDFPGGGFVAMAPEHHEERLKIWANTCGRPILSIDYGKAPEYPYPFAIDEAFDTYRVLIESCGTLIGLSGRKVEIIMSGDSAGATLAVNVVIKILELRFSSSSRPIVLPLPTAVVLNYAALDFNFTSWMTTENLRVLRSEQSSGNIPGLLDLAEQKDHLKHISPLSMVRDNKPLSQRKRVKRRSSWKDTLRGFASGGEDKVDDKQSRRLTASLKSSSKTTMQRNSHSWGDEGAFADAECDDEEEDFNRWREEDRPIQARVIYKYPNAGDNVPRSKSALERQQHELSIAVAEANTKVTQHKVGKGPDAFAGKVKEPLSTRLTMTSRTGYFQDRIVSPSMMRAMAILYIGPHRNPDFNIDYHISPILTPAHLLAQFPPLLMQCGEKDPFVDDTVIFAGRVREAKRNRRIELDLILSGKSARFGESLRMSAAESTTDVKLNVEMKRERDRLANETESDWVQMVLFSEWSHGYLQMPTLMGEAKAVIEELAEWIDDAFSRYRPVVSHEENSTGRDNKDQVITKHTSPPKTFGHEPSRSPLASETETDDAGITFVPRRHLDESRRPSLESAHQSVRIVLKHKGGSESGSSGTSIETDGSKEQKSEGRIISVDLGARTPENGHKVSTPRLTGQTITETELMRRRRLLDSHIFD